MVIKNEVTFKHFLPPNQHTVLTFGQSTSNSTCHSRQLLLPPPPSHLPTFYSSLPTKSPSDVSPIVHAVHPEIYMICTKSHQRRGRFSAVPIFYHPMPKDSSLPTIQFLSQDGELHHREPDRSSLGCILASLPILVHALP
mmetsp:Transcript_16742/g.35151  ORF Transcript_16742/g.35151 Transcript_16742/m.35151 type:complete len:140 (+) Transcript_16742:253-672(+)